MAAREVVLVRHGAVDYGCLTSRARVYEGGRYDFAPLSDEGVSQVQQLVPILALRRPCLIVSSPYTRTLQTAAILSTGLASRLMVNLDLHDWLPVRDGRQLVSADIVATKIAEYAHWKARGVLPPSRTWETDQEMRARLLAAVRRHNTGQGLVVVTHEAVIKSVVGTTDVPIASWHILSTG